jgi:hypothetical protein
MVTQYFAPPGAISPRPDGVHGPDDLIYVRDVAAYVAENAAPPDPAPPEA